MTNKPIVITGDKAISDVTKLAQLRYWSLTAHMKALGFTPRQGWTIKAFNAQYGQSARTWTQVSDLAQGLLEQIRTELGIS